MNEELWVALAVSDESNDESDTISGRISRYKGVNTEVFSALLSPVVRQENTLTGGATAIISVSAASDSLHLSVIFNGIFKKSDANNVSIVIELIPTKNLPPVAETVVMKKVFSVSILLCSISTF